MHPEHFRLQLPFRQPLLKIIQIYSSFLNRLLLAREFRFDPEKYSLQRKDFLRLKHLKALLKTRLILLLFFELSHSNIQLR